MTLSKISGTPCFEKGVDGLLPAIVQDVASGRVLMMAWMNPQSFAETLATGRACYYSRSRRQLWRKGETSGHVQQVHRIQIDCDADSILLQVTQAGAACHEGYQSCFFRTVQQDLSATIEEPRLVDPATVYSSGSGGHE